MCKNQFIDINKINFKIKIKKIYKDESKCCLNNVKVTCLEKHPNKPLCLFHNSIFDIWSIHGGYKILADKSLSDNEKYQLFLKDFNEMDFLTHDIKFSDETIGFIENHFKEKFKFKNWK